MKRPKTQIANWTPAKQAAHDRVFDSVEREVEIMTDARLYMMLFHSIRESARRRDRDSVIKQLRGQADCLERGLVH